MKGDAWDAGDILYVCIFSCFVKTADDWVGVENSELKKHFGVRLSGYGPIH